MANDREVLREVWDGRVPIKFYVSEDDETSMINEIQPYHILVPRMSYLPLLTGLKRHFNQYIPHDPHRPIEVWYEYENTPLKWHIPIGVLYDLVGGGKLPWEIKLRISDFPAEKLIRLGSNVDETVKQSFIHNVKEAGYMKHQGAVWNHLLPAQTTQLWKGLHKDKFDEFWVVNHRLMEHINNDPYQYIPFRIYTDMHERYIQKPFKPINDDVLTTLGDLLHKCMPVSVVETENPDDPYKVRDGVTVRIQGVEPPLVTPVQWLSEHLSHADNFLYIVVLGASQAMQMLRGATDSPESPTLVEPAPSLAATEEGAAEDQNS